MAEYRFQREARTPFSEVYNILDGERTVGRIDIHFTSTHVYGTLAVSESITQEDVEELIELADDDLVSSAEAERSDFIVTVWQGRRLGTYTDEDMADEEADTHDGR